MGWFDKTLLGSIVTPFEQKVRIYLKEGYEYDVSSVLEAVFSAFCEQQKSLGYDHELASVMFMAVVINSLEPDGTREMEKFVYLRNMNTLGGMPYHSKAQNRKLPLIEIEQLYKEASSKHLPEWIMDELWSRTNGNSVLLIMFEEIEEKNLEKLNEYFGFGK